MFVLPCLYCHVCIAMLDCQIERDVGCQKERVCCRVSRVWQTMHRSEMNIQFSGANIYIDYDSCFDFDFKICFFVSKLVPSVPSSIGYL
jgi:hypothetical protein